MLLALSCSSNFDVKGGIGPNGTSDVVPPDIARKPGADSKPDSAETIAGQFLARVNITPTHSVEFWELQPGNVLTVQAFDSGAGEQRLELADMLRTAGGHYAGLYRALLNDENASIPGELVDADEHRRSLPIRDARVPLPALPPPLDEPGTGKAVAGDAPATQPGALTTLGLHHSGTLTNVAYGNGIDPAFCSWVYGDSFCPAGYYRYFYGRQQETIYWDALGSNASGAAGATMVVNQSVNGAWKQVLSYPLSGGTSVEAWAGANPNVYQGRLTGTKVAYAERVRLSFPSLSETFRYPDDAQNSFVNGLNGITHRADGWIMSRTQGPSYEDYYGDERGCVAWFSFATDLQFAGDNRCPGLTSEAFATPPIFKQTSVATDDLYNSLAPASVATRWSRLVMPVSSALSPSVLPMARPTSIILAIWSTTRFTRSAGVTTCLSFPARATST
jgi:hypothetical protein